MTTTRHWVRVIRRALHLSATIAVIWMVAGCSMAAVTESPGDAMAPMVQRMFIDSGAHGMVIAIIRGDHTSIQGYGETRPGSGTLPDAQSLVRVGSISKLLAVDLMVKLDAQGKLRLTDPLQRYAPGAYRVPQSASAHPITLFDLATHTSGLPRQADISSDSKVPYAIARWIWLEKQSNLPPPGHSALYSNLAFDFLADALSTSADMPYDQALQRYVTQPLDMHDTTDAPSFEQCHRLMDGGEPNPAGACANSSGNAGSGGMYSTAADMANWMKQQLGINPRGSSPETAISQAIYFQRQALVNVQGMDNGGHADGLGMGWVLLAATNQHPAIIEKTGGGGGFMSYMALVPGRQIGIFVTVSKVDLAMLQALAQHVNDLSAQLARADELRH